MRARKAATSGICRCFWTVPVRGQSGSRGRREVLDLMRERMGDVGDPPTTGDGDRRIVHIRRCSRGHAMAPIGSVLTVQKPYRDPSRVQRAAVVLGTRQWRGETANVSSTTKHTVL